MKTKDGRTPGEVWLNALFPGSTGAAPIEERAAQSVLDDFADHYRREGAMKALGALRLDDHMCIAMVRRQVAALFTRIESGKDPL